ncbi:unnamed protein product [Nippostrongylus brasiliensis]|uniref:Wsv094 n=1 Tax=Nippostrongylus brasiliensis TaxID=27835 RepID=A0A0N4YL42_NIPBR|nr:unnamed protein product [Nippostrongylus brasiliensis]
MMVKNKILITLMVVMMMTTLMMITMMIMMMMVVMIPMTITIMMMMLECYEYRSALATICALLEFNNPTSAMVYCFTIMMIMMMMMMMTDGPNLYLVQTTFI